MASSSSSYRPTIISSSVNTATKMGARSAAARSKTPESIESLRQRNEAAEILQSYERLSWYSAARCETLAQTRIHFQCVVAGISAAQEDANVYWREDFTPHPVKPNPQHQQASSSRKSGKERVSGGSATFRKKGGSPKTHKAKEKEVVGSV